MKRFLAITLALSILLGLVACKPPIVYDRADLENSKSNEKNNRYSTFEYIESVTSNMASNSKNERETNSSIIENVSSITNSEMLDYFDEKDYNEGLDSETKEIFETITADKAEAYGGCGENLKWYYQDGVLIIKGKGEMKNDYLWDYYNNIEAYESFPEDQAPPWYKYRENIHTVIVGKGCTSIGFCAFFELENLTKVVLPKTLKMIGARAFGICKKLISITFPEGLTSIGAEAFLGCDNLTTVIIPESVTNIYGGAFWNCYNLSSVNIPEGVTKIEVGTFYMCQNLTSITIPESVTSIDWMAFFFCSNLTSITIPDSVTSIGEDSFAYCYSLNYITLPSELNIDPYTDDRFFLCLDIKNVSYT